MLSGVALGTGTMNNSGGMLQNIGPDLEVEAWTFTYDRIGWGSLLNGHRLGHRSLCIQYSIQINRESFCFLDSVSKSSVFLEKDL